MVSGPGQWVGLDDLIFFSLNEANVVSTRNNCKITLIYGVIPESKSVWAQHEDCTTTGVPLSLEISVTTMFDSVLDTIIIITDTPFQSLKTLEILTSRFHLAHHHHHLKTRAIQHCFPLLHITGSDAKKNNNPSLKQELNALGYQSQEAFNTASCFLQLDPKLCLCTAMCTYACIHAREASPSTSPETPCSSSRCVRGFGW